MVFVAAGYRGDQHVAVEHELAQLPLPHPVIEELVAALQRESGELAGPDVELLLSREAAPAAV